MKRFIFFSYFFLIMILFLELVSSLEIGISPSEITLSVNQNQKKCINFTLFSDRDVSFDINSFWSESKSRKIENYKLYPIEQNLSFSYKPLNKTKDESNYQMCLSGGKPGDYYGVLIARIHDKNAAVGMWTNLKVNGKNVFFDSLGLTLESDEVNENLDKKSALSLEVLLFISTFLFLIFLLLLSLLYIKKNKRRLEE